MSYQRALDAVNLRLDGIAQCENLDHPLYVQELAGIDPWERPYEAYLAAFRALDLDWVHGIPRQALPRNTFERDSSVELADGMRMTAWGITGSRWREEFQFQTVEDVLAYDPLANVPPVDHIAVKGVPGWHHAMVDEQRAVGDSFLLSGPYYTTLFQCGIMVFGWPLFLTAAGAEPERFQRILEGFATLTARNIAELAAERLPFLFIHDDIAMQHGMVFHPNWYRKRIFPLYERILEPVLANGVTRICFVSDGDYTAVVPDLFALGFHGLMISPNMDLGAIARRYARDRFLVGNVDTAVLTFGDADDVRREVARCIAEGRAAGGHIIKAIGDMPDNIPIANLRAYFRAVARYRR
ncbi:MAG: hypothetical protein GX557_07920 [Chloroflexi bacterium]|nr:hypothetical protein [Chloroflexota bacterium]